MSSQQVVDFTRRAIANGDDLGKIAEDMMMKCMARDSESAGIGCDNMTVVIVALLNGRSPEEWKAWVKERVEKKIGYDTPESVPDVFPNQPAAPSGGIGMGGYRIGGAGGGLANIASILSAQGITFRTPEEDSDEEGDLQLIGDEPEKIPQGSDVYMDDKGIKGKNVPKNVSNELVSLTRIPIVSLILIVRRTPRPTRRWTDPLNLDPLNLMMMEIQQWIQETNQIPPPPATKLPQPLPHQRRFQEATKKVRQLLLHSLQSAHLKLRLTRNFNVVLPTLPVFERGRMIHPHRSNCERHQKEMRLVQLSRLRD